MCSRYAVRFRVGHLLTSTLSYPSQRQRICAFALWPQPMLYQARYAHFLRTNKVGSYAASCHITLFGSGISARTGTSSPARQSAHRSQHPRSRRTRTVGRVPGRGPQKSQCPLAGTRERWPNKRPERNAGAWGSGFVCGWIGFSVVINSVVVRPRVAHFGRSGYRISQLKSSSVLKMRILQPEVSKTVPTGSKPEATACRAQSTGQPTCNSGICWPLLSHTAIAPLGKQKPEPAITAKPLAGPACVCFSVFGSTGWWCSGFSFRRGCLTRAVR